MGRKQEKTNKRDRIISPADDPNLLITFQEYPQVLPLSQATMWRFVKEGKIQTFKPVGGRRVFLRLGDVLGLVRPAK
jgi:hypothetical protein